MADRSQICCLQWDKHQRATISSLLNNVLKKETPDCTLVADGHRLKAHKVVLCAWSPCLEIILSEEKDTNPTPDTMFYFINSEAKKKELIFIILENHR
ncbi:hypothetical protein M8J77_007481 [Diaphorina citri]|nr:hypothetical protein M8J77_007481 [Diaphorina citri]